MVVIIVTRRRRPTEAGVKTQFVISTLISFLSAKQKIEAKIITNAKASH